MPREPKGYYDMQQSEDEYRRRQEVKAKRRKKRRMQRIMLLCAFALAFILLVVVIIAVFRLIFGGEKTPSSSVPPPVSSVSLPPEPSYTHPTATDPSVWNLKLVNGQNPLTSGFSMAVGSDEGQIGEFRVNIGGIYDTFYFDNRILDSLQQMMQDCNAVEGHSLSILSGYRGWENQHNRNVTKIQELMAGGQTAEMAQLMAESLEPAAGHSEHQIGLAVDFRTGSVQAASNEFANTPEYQWLLANAANYGFIPRYPAEKVSITGMEFEPYHWRFVGTDDAHQIAGSGICLEEYLLQYTPDTGAPDAGADAGGDGGTASGSGSDYDGQGQLNEPSP